jgi:DNA invertase Pin-like site-specific DNA recombinase
MVNIRFVSYLRVSTARQGASGLGLEAQRSAVAGYPQGEDWTLVREVVEIENGKRNDRPALAEALRLCRRQRATLVIAKLDRLARNVVFIATLMEEKVPFVAVDMPSANDLTVHILAAVAQDEAKRISDRTKAALTAAKVRGTKLAGCASPRKTSPHSAARARLPVRRFERQKLRSSVKTRCLLSRRSKCPALPACAPSLPNSMHVGKPQPVADRGLPSRCSESLPASQRTALQRP